MVPKRQVLAMWWAVAAVWLLARALTVQAASKDYAPNKGAAEVKGLPAEVKGFGLTPEAAQKDAVNFLIQELTTVLQRQVPPIDNWKPTAEFVQTRLLDGVGRAGPDFEVPNDRPRKTWIYNVRPLDLRLVRQLDDQARREARSEARVLWAGHAVGAILFVIAVGLGYLRLDERTGGRHRRLLQAGALTVAATAALAGWWLLH